MIAHRCTPEDVREALRLANGSFRDNLEFRAEPERTGRTDRSGVAFTLTVRDIRGPGGRRGFRRRKDGELYRIAGCACWHAHGVLFEALAFVAPKARVVTWAGSIEGPSTAEGNWQEVDAGVAYYSALCDCGKEGGRKDARGLFGRPGRWTLEPVEGDGYGPCPDCNEPLRDVHYCGRPEHFAGYRGRSELEARAMVERVGSLDGFRVKRDGSFAYAPVRDAAGARRELEGAGFEVLGPVQA